MSAGPPLDQVHLALGHDPLDRRADLRTGGWSAVPGERVLVLLDPTGEVAVVRGADRSARLATVGVGDRPGIGESDPAGLPRGAAATREASSTGRSAESGSSTSADPARPADSATSPDPARPADPTRPADPEILLGVDPTGLVWCGRVVERDDPVVPPSVQWAGLRDVGLRLPEDERGILAEFLALANWHRTHTRCPRCGTPTEVAGLGWWRTCPEDGSEHYPRTDPAVIALLIDDECNALLGRQTRWPEGAFSTLAGFVEPGESAESAVVREISEEVGLVPAGSTYIGSQPWPFPASLMLGYHATIAGVRPEPHPDGVEIAEARWISRSELPALCQSREVRLPGRLSIAHHLVRLWYGQPLPDEWCRW
jgi:NADH pyrophosphatase NudC (nudix superfamily)